MMPWHSPSLLPNSMSKFQTYGVSHPLTAPLNDRGGLEIRLAATLTLIPSINAPLNASIDTFSGAWVRQSRAAQDELVVQRRLEIQKVRQICQADYTLLIKTKPPAAVIPKRIVLTKSRNETDALLVVQPERTEIAITERASIGRLRDEINRLIEDLRLMIKVQDRPVSRFASRQSGDQPRIRV